MHSSNARIADGQSRRVLVTITEAWFALSHFKALLQELVTLFDEVVVATRGSGRVPDLEALGVRVRECDMRRGSLNPLAQLRARRTLAGVVDQERPDVVHAIAMQTIMLVSMALRVAKHRPPVAIFHLTGPGYVGIARSPQARFIRLLAGHEIRRTVREQGTWLIAENDDDTAMMLRRWGGRRERTVVVPGSGIDPEIFPALPAPNNAKLQAAFVGRMLWTKGVGVLVAAQRLLRSQGIAIDLALYGETDATRRDAIPRSTLAAWAALPGVSWKGYASDICDALRGADVFVLPSLINEGMPRAMLEAAACARPLLVSDVSGCRHFVRHGVEGLLVPPNDVQSLADALRQLAENPALRQRLAVAARARLATSYTVQAVREAIRDVYLRSRAGRE
jgi:glycosyltransferase involved in cell wall biosynthesis